jgi:hypothetical protein
MMEGRRRGLVSADRLGTEPRVRPPIRHPFGNPPLAPVGRGTQRQRTRPIGAICPYYQSVAVL